MFRFLRSFASQLAFIVILAGCVAAAAPLEELQSLRASFLDVQKAGDLLYDEISPIISAGSKIDRDCGPDAAGTPRCFDPALAGRSGGTVNEHEAIRARRAALALVSEYSQALVDLAEGRSVDRLAGRIDEIAGMATAVATLVGSGAAASLPALLTGGAAASLKHFASQVEKARAAQTVRTALIANRQTVANVIDGLIADTGPMYDVYYRARRVEMLKATGLDKSPLSRAADYHRSLSAYVVMLRQTRLAYARLADRAQRPPSTAEIRTTIEDATRLKLSAETFRDSARRLGR